MGEAPNGPDEPLGQTIDRLIDSGADLDGYTFTPVAGATQATVWRGVAKWDGQPDVALRLTPKPLELVRRIAALVDSVESVECPRTLATERLDVGERTWTVHLCTWIGVGAPRKTDMTSLGQHLARLHLDLAATSADFTDRRLSFERNPTPPAEQQLPTWYVARHLWRDRIFAWLYTQTGQMAPQPIHGDMHWGNVVATTNGFGFIDFDKVMYAPAVFDLAKLIATGMFRTGERVRFQARKTTQLLEGYESVRSLSDAELVALEGLAVLLNEETARLGSVYDLDSYRRTADAVAAWWIARRRRTRSDPLGIRTARQAPAGDRETPGQQALWPRDPTNPH
ncbi:MAG: phosphotransferase enzyme family protein [Pseudonocardiaceae bacterium]